MKSTTNIDNRPSKRRITACLTSLLSMMPAFSYGAELSSRPSLLQRQPVSEVVITPSPSPTPVPRVVEKKTTDVFDINRLPLRYGDWVLDISVKSAEDKPECEIRSLMSTIADGQSSSPLFVTATSDSIHVLTESTIDVSYAQSGINIDDNALFSWDAVYADTNVIFTTNADALIAQMRKGSKATITLGFWPERPMTRSFSTEVSLSGFTKAMRAVNKCQRALET